MGTRLLERVKYYDKLPQNQGIIFDLPMMEGTGLLVRDISRYHNHGTIFGATWTLLASGQWWLSFNGIGDYVDCGKGAAFQDLSIFTWRCWASVDNLVGGNNYCMAKRHYKHFSIRNDAPAGRLRGTMTTSLQAAVTFTNEVVTPGVPALITMTYDDTGDRRLYFRINGVPCTYSQQTPATGVMTPEADATDGKLIIGAYSTTEILFPGDIYRPRVFNIVVPVSEDQSYFNRTRSILGV